MYAVFTELDVPSDASEDQARQTLNSGAIPMVKGMGATAGYWLTVQGGRGVSVVVFPDEDSAKKMASMLSVGDPPPGAPEGVTFRTVEVRQVLAHF